MKAVVIAITAVGISSASLLLGQVVPNPTQTNTVTGSDAGQPIFRVTVVSRTIKAINYRRRSGATKVDFRGTSLMPQAKGEANVESNTGATKMHLRFEKLDSASRFGPEYLTYVLWAVTPEGRAKNLGEVDPKGGTNAQLEATTDFQSFGMIVTAEPYFAVSQPSDVVVMENFVRNDTTGTIEDVEAKYDLLQRGTYTMNVSADKLAPIISDAKVPLQLREAREAISIARAQGAERYANDTLQKALVDLQNAEDYYRGRKGENKKPLETVAREATQMAEDARIISVRREQAEQLAAERAAAAQREADAKAREADAKAREADAKAQADAEAQRRAQAEADARASEQARAQAERMKHEAELAAADAARQKADADAARLQAEQARQQSEQARLQADAARQAALAQQQAAQADADRARQAAAQAEAEKAQMRQRLLDNLNQILATRDTARGLIATMSDVLFDFNKSTLKPIAREKLARVSGIIVANPGLKLKIEGHTDSIGSDEYNQVLSEKRAATVRDFLAQNGISGNDMVAVGLGKADPLASNDTAAGRQQNRRVDLVVSGDIIGTPFGTTTSTTPVPPSAGGVPANNVGTVQPQR